MKPNKGVFHKELPFTVFLEKSDLSEDQLLLRMGFKRLQKGKKILADIKAGDMRRADHYRHMFAKALEVDVGEIEHVIAETKTHLAKLEKAEFLATFKPHALVLTERRVPEPIFIAVLGGFDKKRRIDFAPDSNPTSYLSQLMKQLPEDIPTFGKTTGFIINYAADYAVCFDLSGDPIEAFDEAVQLGSGSLSISGRPVTADTLVAQTNEKTL